MEIFGRVSVALVTPFVDVSIDLEQPIDEEGVASMVRYVAQNLSSVRSKYDMIGGIIMSGTTGEQHSMTVEERSRLYAIATASARAYNVPIIAGIAGTTCAAVGKLTLAALNAGCEGIMLGLPPYIKLGDEEIRAYIQTVSNAVPKGFPILLYNNVARNGYGPSHQLLCELCQTEVIWGIKHAVPPDQFITAANELLAMEPSIRLYTGSDKAAIDILDFGAADRDREEGQQQQQQHQQQQQQQLPKFYGLTSIVGNIYPAEIATMIANLTLCSLKVPTPTPTTALAASVDVGKLMHTDLVQTVDATLVGCGLPVGVKHALRALGLRGGFTRQPIGVLTAEKAKKIEDTLIVFKESKHFRHCSSI
jgi:dihydrodipicolinate synthase/N-acetylneuraminate lyase